MPNLQPIKLWSRRDFLYLSSLAAAGTLVSCATDPVTGKSTFNLVSEQDEIGIDKQHSPQQFSSDYGKVQDKSLNRYLDTTGRRIAAQTHRPTMPYSFRAVNATYVNAYAFPGGSIAATRGILLKLDNEAELAALLGHEIGHVNARHSAESMSKGMVAQFAVVLGSAALGAAGYGGATADVAQQLGMLGAGALLASYSRDNEREADALGMEYMVRANYNPEGMVGLMEVLQSLNKHKSNSVQLLFATHPMSDERFNTAVRTAREKYASAADYPLHKERYMDNIASLRAIQGAIEEMQKGESLMARKKVSEAETHFRTALKKAPNDYAGLLLLSKCLLAQNRQTEALRYAEKAAKVYPQEAQAHYISGFVHLRKKNYSPAYREFSSYERLLPGNPNTIFFKGYALEGMGTRNQAAQEYYRYLKQVNQGKQAQYAYQRLKQWRYVK